HGQHVAEAVRMEVVQPSVAECRSEDFSNGPCATPVRLAQAGCREIAVAVRLDVGRRENGIVVTEQQLGAKVAQPVLDDRATFIPYREEPGIEGLGELGLYVSPVLVDAAV